MPAVAPTLVLSRQRRKGASGKERERAGWLARPLHFHRFCLKIDVDRDSGTAGVPAIEQIIPIAAVIDVNIVGLIPGWAPVFRIGIHHCEPAAAVLEARVASFIAEGKAIDAKEVVVAEVAAEVVVGYTIAAVAAACSPAAVFVIPMTGAPLLPDAILLGALIMFLLAEMAAVVTVVAVVMAGRLVVLVVSALWLAVVFMLRPVSVLSVVLPVLLLILVLVLVFVLVFVLIVVVTLGEADRASSESQGQNGN